MSLRAFCSRCSASRRMPRLKRRAQANARRPWRQMSGSATGKTIKLDYGAGTCVI